MQLGDFNNASQIVIVTCNPDPYLRKPAPAPMVSWVQKPGACSTKMQGKQSIFCWRKKIACQGISVIKSVICCIFTKSSFWLHSYFDILHTSDLFLTQLCTCLNLSLLFKLYLSFYLSFYLFSVLPINSVLLSFDHLLSYSLIILCTLVPFHHSLSSHVNIYCMWFSLCLATSFPSLPLLYLVISLVFDSTPISIVMTTLYESDSIYNKL